MVTAAALTAPISATMVRCLLERKESPARESTRALRTGRERSRSEGAEARRDPARASRAQRASWATISKRRFCAPTTGAYWPTRRPKITLASVPPPPIRPNRRFASRAWKTSLASVQNWITTSEPIASTKMYSAA